MAMVSTQTRALVVDAEGTLARSVMAIGLKVERVAAADASTIDRIDEALFDVVVVDLESPGSSELVAAQAQRFPDLPLVAVGSEVSDDSPPDSSVRSRAEWVTRSEDPSELRDALSRVAARAARQSVMPPPPRLAGSRLLGDSPPILRVRELIDRIAPGDATVLIRGETGTGKELVARSLHDQSGRKNGPLVKAQLAALPDSLLESELFGYEKGAFTGAAGRKPGRVELAQGGTLFLDEIGEVPPAVQAKLLRLIQDREYERLGGTRALKADVRFITATHRDLEHMVEEGTFREDLFYRLNVVSVWLPPLRARRDDIPLLARDYAAKIASAMDKSPITLDDSAVKVLRSQRWPGNVRQLLNLVERLVVLASVPTISAEDVQREFEEQVSFTTQSTQGGLDAAVAETSREASLQGVPSTVRPLREELRRTERRALEKALASAKGNRSLAARLLGVSRRTLYTKLEEHGLD